MAVSVGTVDERVLAVEGRVAEQAGMIDSLRDAVASLDRRVTSLELRTDQRFTGLESRMDQRFATLDQRFEQIDGRFTGLDEKISRQFRWTLGVQVTLFITIIAALLSRS